MSYYAVPKDRLIELLSLPKKRILASVLHLLRSCEELVEEENDGGASDSSQCSTPGATEVSETVELLSEPGSTSSDSDVAAVDGHDGVKEAQEQSGTL